MSSFDEALRDAMREMVTDDEHLREALREIADSAVEGAEILDREDVATIAYEQAESYHDYHDSDGGGGLDLSEANGYFRSVAAGNDCSDGDAFREAVLAVVRADAVRSGGARDGSHMDIRIDTEDPRAVATALRRRAETYGNLQQAVRYLMGAAPNGVDSLPPESRHDEEAQAAWRTRTKREAEAQRRERLQQRETKRGEVQVQVCPAQWEQMRTERAQLWSVVAEAVKLLSLLSSLAHGREPSMAVADGHRWEHIVGEIRNDYHTMVTPEGDAPEA